ncbi:t-SNARE affecting a late Golgi compartment protein 2 [Vanrija albida]|uniref:t-SNARE affecting a late Golgi compartment protein 2 n=1 Tax=Vanrija albida TaxID=181172 RepID=A0ABR3Q2Y8_9TREE
MANPYAAYSASGPSSSSAASSSRAPQQQQQPLGVTRSRTLFYLSVRDSSTFSSARGSRIAAAQYGDTVDVADDEQGRLLGGGSHRVDMNGLPPKWVDISDEVEEILSRVESKVTALDKLHAKHVLPGFNDRSKEEAEIERQTADITRDFRRCSSLVASITPGQRPTRVELVTATNVQRGLAQKVQDASGQFRKKQRVYMQKLQGHAIKNKDLLAASGAITLRGSDGLDELAEDEEATRNLQSQSQTQAQSHIAIDIQQRSNEVQQIAQSIAELAELFRDLGNLVVEQGTVLDTVEYNVMETSRAMEHAVDELKTAQRYQSNTGRRRCILLLILIIVGLVIVLVYKPRRHAAPEPVTSAAPDAPAALDDAADVYDDDGFHEVTDPSEPLWHDRPSPTTTVASDSAIDWSRPAGGGRPHKFPTVDDDEVIEDRL